MCLGPYFVSVVSSISYIVKREAICILSLCVGCRRLLIVVLHSIFYNNTYTDVNMMFIST